LASKRVRKGEFFDSAFGTAADFTPRSAPRAPSRPPSDSSSEIAIEDEVIAVAIDSDSLRAQVTAALGSRGLAFGGPDLLPGAALVIVDSSGDVTQRVADVRRRARPDAALIVILGRPSAADVASAHAAGAFACARPPLVPAELLSFVASALDSRAAKVQAADLARKLDLESHLASIGRVTAGLAHEIGNPLGIAILNTEVIRRDIETLLPTSGASAESAAELRGAIADTISSHARLEGLLEAMRALVRAERKSTQETVDLLGLVQDIRKWLEEELQGVDVEVLGEPVRARANVTMLGQILHNLVANAAHAARSLASPRLRLHVYASGPRVVVSVRDNGPGIPAELHDKIFEPFFTTRRGQGGTGLGLALCLEYALQMGADLSFWSVPGRGTCFRVSLPAAP
jgi:signal transduction histidine kinase